MHVVEPRTEALRWERLEQLKNMQPDLRIPMTTDLSFAIGGDLLVHRIGFGAMRLCGQPGNFGPYPDWEAGIRLLREASSLGVQLFDTAHPYGPGFNEQLIADALAPGPRPEHHPHPGHDICRTLGGKHGGRKDSPLFCPPRDTCAAERARLASATRTRP